MSIGHAESLASRPSVREQRSEPRKDLCVEATICPVDGRAISATTANVSAHGVDLSCMHELRPSTRCEVAFALPVGNDWRAVKLQACVVRSTTREDDYSLGLVFFGMPERTKELLELFICS